MSGTATGTPGAGAPGEPRSGDYMQSLVVKIEADVASRKRPRAEAPPALRSAAVLLVACLGAFVLGARSGGGWASRVLQGSREAELAARADALQGQLDLQRLQTERLQRAYNLSSKYDIGADLAMAIEEIALAEGVTPSLAFELVRVESSFTARAISPVGALGYTQLMPSTARMMAPGITREEIFDRNTNLRLGFRFFHDLVDHYDGDIRLALLAYNRGPDTVDRLLRAGIDPGNGYSRLVLGE
jgi:soluble lytic murein transglycosylase-like protein